MAKKEGRPTKYKKEFAEQARKLCLLGFIDEELADFFNVQVSTLNNWKKAHPQFLESLRSGKSIADADVADSLYNRALGYSHKEDKIMANSQNPHDPVIVETTKHYPPDTGAAFIWLKNRQPEKWRDKKEPEVDAGDIVEAFKQLANGLPD